MRKFLIFNFSFLICLLFIACSHKQQTTDRPAFCADSAYAFVQAQLAFGPRVPNSDAHMQCAIWLIEKLREYGAEVELQKGFMPDYRGNNQQIYNIIGHFGPADSNRLRILLAAHYDTRPWCDEEELQSDRAYNVPGANDGASGVGVLLEIARQISLTTNDKRQTTPVDIIFFDVEDSGTPRFYTGMERENTWCLGSQLWATEYVKNNLTGEAGLTATRSNSEAVYQPKAVQYQFGILLDMVGAPEAVFPLEYFSTRYAQNYQQRIWRKAGQLGYGSLFTNKQSAPITDDHYYINTIAGIPCVDIIHYNMNSATGFASWWHTRQDNMDHISRSTLQAVGEVVMSQL